MFRVFALVIAILLLSQMSSEANQYKKEKILHLPFACTNGGCVDGGVYIQLISANEENTVFRVEHVELQAYWDANAAVYCRTNGQSEVVYSFQPNADARERVWIKYQLEKPVIGFTTPTGNVVEHIMEYANYQNIQNEIEISLNKEDNKILPFRFEIERILWISSAIIARSCAVDWLPR